MYVVVFHVCVVQYIAVSMYYPYMFSATKAMVMLAVLFYIQSVWLW